jgi:DNA-binding XRE family transcriptional regulator
MTKSLLARSAFSMSTTSAAYRFYPADPLETCADPHRDALLAAIGIVRRPNARMNDSFSSSTSASSSMDGFTGFATALGLEDEIREARKELATKLKVNAGATDLRALRLAAGLSQRDLALALQTSQSRISALEAGREGMSLTFARRMSNILNVSLDQLCDATDSMVDRD